MKTDLTKYNRQPLFRTTAKTKPAQAQGRDTNLVLSEFDKDVMVVRNYADLKLQTLVAYDVVLLDYAKKSEASQMLWQIRNSAFDELYLKPVFISIHGNEVDELDQELADGIITGVSLEAHLDIIDGITERTEEVLKITTDFKGKKLLLKLIRFLYTRDKELNPVATPKSHMGYAFPFLDANINHDEYEELIALLEDGQGLGYLQTELEDHVHLCHSCHSGFINYRETCPKCDSHKFKTEHTIHHFVCGYVGPESDFQNEHKIQCPKCDRQLRHIGVDYDKPSLVMECEHGHIFQEPEMKTLCFNCKTEATPQDLITYPVNQYGLTASGAEAAISGQLKAKKGEDSLEGFISFGMFKTMLRLEIERLKVNQQQSALSYLKVMFCPATYKKHQGNFDGFMQEVARIVKSQLKATQMICQLDDEVFLIMSPESDMEKVEEQLSLVREKTIGMIRSQCQGSKQDELVFETFDLATDQSMEQLMDEVNQKVNIY